MHSGDSFEAEGEKGAVKPNQIERGVLTARIAE